ncbi:uncharacterized protein TNCT_229501 [Trichonephila clavata]|uniref:Uncharacterized protein n=1 Tax=Trichonephila clavata TaxID=2740835 RepID=A0A8X6HVX5_TRICU|nr:uncharacterized protein TNCT_729831 [Trichonephila clavata]GFR29510.1 uncharacterized protein TNCT_229501 [Trichonephila clavata]
MDSISQTGSDSESSELRRVVLQTLSEELQRANNCTSRFTVCVRVLQQICDIINISFHQLPDLKNMIKLEESFVRNLTVIWNSQNHDSSDELEKILAKDYVKPIDLTRCIACLVKKELKKSPSHMKPIYQLLAVDGFLGNDVKRYVEYLKYQEEYKKVHLEAVRKLYHHLEKPEEVLNVLFHAFEWKSNDEETLKLEYLKNVGYFLEDIMRWKHEQYEEEKKKSNGKKRKRVKEVPIVQDDRSSSSSVSSDED